ncbi:MAG: alpha/beta fold hydrolase [Acidimicrobiia bacterium]
MAHATGFCKDVWEPLVAELRRRGVGLPATAWDFLAHGDSYLPDPPYDWWDFGRDALRVLSADGSKAVGIGHSSGGASLAMAEILRPGTFAGLVLVEPIILPPPFRRSDDSPLAEGAERRKPSFPTLSEARANFASKEAFASWDPRSLDAYLTGGLAERDGAWWLKCPPWAEAEVYRTASAHGAWERLGEVGAPVLVVAGERSDSYGAAFGEAMTGRIPKARSEVVADTGHFLPMERPDRLAELVAEFLTDLPPPSGRG